MCVCILIFYFFVFRDVPEFIGGRSFDVLTSKVRNIFALFSSVRVLMFCSFSMNICRNPKNRIFSNGGEGVGGGYWG